MPIKGKQIINNSLPLNKLSDGVKILSNSSVLGSDKTPGEITDNREFTSKQYVDVTITNSIENNITASDVSVNGTNFEVINMPTDLQDYLIQNDEFLLNARSTGVRYGGAVTVNATSSGLVDVEAVSGQLLNNTDPENPTFNRIFYAGTNGYLVPDNVVSWLYVDSNNTLNHQTTEPTFSEKRLKVYLARISKNAGVITGLRTNVILSQQYGGNLSDLAEAIGIIKLNGLEVVNASTDLTLRITQGSLFSFGANFQSDSTNPNTISYANRSPVTFRMVKQDTGSIDVDVTELPVGQYDNNGTITNVGGNGSRTTIFTVYMFESGNIRIAYGQDTYRNIQTAREALNTRNFVEAPNFDNAIKLGYILTKRTTTDLSDTDDAQFVITNQFGGIGGGVSGALNGYLETSENLADLGDISIARTNLDVESSTELDARDTANRDRANHTGTQEISTIVDAGALASLDSVNTAQIDNDAVTYSKIQNVVSNNVILGNNSGAGTVVDELSAAEVRTIINVEDGANNYTHPNHTGDVTSVGDGATTIANNVVSNAKLRDSSALSVIGRSANSTGDPADITAASDGQVLRRSGTTLGFGTIAAAGISSNAITTVKINNDAVTNTKLANMAQSTIKGRASGAGTGDPTDLTPTQVRTMIGAREILLAVESIVEGSWSGNTNYTYDVTVSGVEVGDFCLVVPDENIYSDMQTAGSEYNGFAYCDTAGTVSVNHRVTSFVSITSGTFTVVVIK